MAVEIQGHLVDIMRDRHSESCAGLDDLDGAALDHKPATPMCACGGGPRICGWWGPNPNRGGGEGAPAQFC